MPIERDALRSLKANPDDLDRLPPSLNLVEQAVMSVAKAFATNVTGQSNKRPDNLPRLRTTPAFKCASVQHRHALPEINGASCFSLQRCGMTRHTPCWSHGGQE
jgi:hypothetical protein